MAISFLSSLAKWKLRWALVTGAFTLIVWPIVKLVFKSRSGEKTSKRSEGVIDVKAEEIK